MPRYAAFLRAVNVGGRVIQMAVLRDLFVECGFTEVETFIASGNVIFRSASRNTKAMERRVEQAMRAAFGYEVPTFIRTEAEVATLAAWMPFSPKQAASAHSLSIGLLESPLDAAARRKLTALNIATDVFETKGAAVFRLSTIKTSDSKFTLVGFEKLLGQSATFRGINTIKRMAAKYPPPGNHA